MNPIGHLKAIMTGLKYLFIEKRVTLLYPEEVEDLPRGYRGMPHYNMEKCISCAMCARICPAGAIKMVLDNEQTSEKKVKRHPSINYNRCIFCGFCVDICPTGALEYTQVHDYAAYKMDDLILKPERFEISPVKLIKPFFKRKTKIVRLKLDEEVGLRYESTG